jgi:hypothetical protein
VLSIGREKNPERCAFYELCWLLGGSHSAIAYLKAEDVDWNKLVFVTGVFSACNSAHWNCV